MNILKEIIQDYWRYFITFLRRFEAVYHYAKIGFRDKDWDYYFLQKLLKIKLERMKAHFLASDIAEGDKETAEQISKALRHLELWMNTEEWETEEYIKLKVRFGIVQKFVPVEINGNKYSRMKTESTTGQSIATFTEKVKELNQVAQRRSLENKNEFFHVLRSNIERWWN